MKKDFEYYKQKAKEFYLKGDTNKARYYKKKAYELKEMEVKKI